MDVKVLVLKVQFTGPEYTKVLVEWWSTRGVDLKVKKQTIKVRREDWPYWKFVGSTP